MPSGSCLCGNVKYEYEGEPAMKAICHCLTCRKLTGSTYSTNVVVPEAQFKITSTSTGNHAHVKHSHTAAHEAPGITITPYTCAECGTAVMKKGTGPFAGTVIVQCGTLDDADGLTVLAKPDAELWVKYRVPWLVAVEGARQCQEFE